MGKKKRYKNVYIRIVIIYIIINLLLLGSVQVSNYYTQEELENVYVNSMATSLRFHGKNLESKLLYAKNVQDILSDNYRIKWLIYQAPIESSYKIYDSIQEVQELLSAFEGTNSIIKDIGIYIESLNQLISYEKGVIEDLPKVDIGSMRKDWLIIPYKNEFYLVNMPLAIGGTYHSLSYVKISKSELQQVLQDIQDMIEGVEVGLFQDGEPLCITNGFEMDFIENLSEEDGFLSEVDEVRSDQGNYFLFRTNVVSSKLQLIMYFDGDVILAPVKKSNEIFRMCIIISTVALSVFIIYAYYVVNKPLKQLMKVMEKVEKNNFDIDIAHHSQDQFKYIFEGFIRMIDSLKKYIEKNYEQELELKRSELKQLQAQINPHFLYNCFFNISKMCKIEDSKSAMILSQKLARYYMFITRDNEDYVCLEDEYEHTKVYLDIQSIRFGDRVTIQMSGLPAGARKAMVPRIILQPLVENCYKYVFEKLENAGEMAIHTYYEQDHYIVISVEDDGNLITDDEIHRLNAKFVGGYKEGETTGLLNVNRRLKLYFGQESGLIASRGELGGLKIEIKMMLGEMKYV